MFIGHEIYTFDTDNETLKYVSKVRSNRVPYPFAYGGEHYHMFHQKYIPCTLTDEERILKKDLAYYAYGY